MAEIVAFKRANRKGRYWPNDEQRAAARSRQSARQRVVARDDGRVCRRNSIAPAATRAVRVIVIAAAGKVFSAGHDLKEMTAHRNDRIGAGRSSTRPGGLLRPDAGDRHAPKPVIAEVDGLATAAGLQLVASCDLAIASDRATFCTPGVNIGLFCSTPMVALSRNVPRKQAMEMLLTGEDDRRLDRPRIRAGQPRRAGRGITSLRS